MVEVTIDSIRVSLMSQHRVVILKDVDSDRYLPIWIGPCEADAITVTLQEMEVSRPLTHDLLKNVIEGLGHRLTEVRIVELRDGVFHAALVLDGTTEISSRSSDAIALALRTGTTIVAGESLLEEAGVAMSSEEDPDDEVEKFKEFLDHVSAEDFENKPGETGPET